MCEVFFAVLAALLVFSAIRALWPYAVDLTRLALLNRRRETREDGRGGTHQAEVPVRAAVPQPRPRKPAVRAPLPPVSERLSGLIIKRDGDDWRVSAYRFRTRQEAEDYVRERERVCRGED